MNLYEENDDFATSSASDSSSDYDDFNEGPASLAHTWSAKKQDMTPLKGALPTADKSSNDLFNN